MAVGFDPSNAPFDRLSGSEIETVRAALDIAYFRPHETVLARGAVPEGLYIVMKGRVAERDGEETTAMLGPGDAFDARALIQGGGGLAFVAQEETLAYVLARPLVMRLISDNPRFAAFFYTEISRKLEAASAEAEQARFGATMQAQLSDLHMSPPVFVDASASLEAAANIMYEAGVKAIFVRDGEATGILTATNLAKAAILERRPLDARVGPCATYALVGCESGDSVATALLMMTKHNKRRVVVKQKGAYVGVIEDIDLLAFIAGGAQLLGARLDRARDAGELSAAAGEIERQTRTLRRQGVRMDVVCEIVSDLNRRLSLDSDGAASALLGHTLPGDSDPQIVRLSPTTAAYYNLAQHVPLKMAAINAWTEAILDEYKKIGGVPPT